MTKDLKVQATSITARLSDIARKSETPFPYLLTQFLLERIAARLTSEDKLARHIVFKGGYVGLRVHHSPRYTVDLDALVVGLPLIKAAEQAKTSVVHSNAFLKVPVILASYTASFQPQPKTATI